MIRIAAISFIFLILLLLLPIASRSVLAHEMSSAKNAEYTVVKGDTLNGIAKKFGVTVKDLYKANNLKSDLILPGMKLTIPGPSEAASSRQPSPVSPEESQVPTKKNPMTTERPSVITKEPSVSPGDIDFKWALVARLDPEGRNKVVNVAQDVLTPGSSNLSVSAGDKIALYVEPGENTYIYFYMVDSGKNLELIFPTGLDKKTLEDEFASGKGTYAPGKFDWFLFDEKKGEETFYLIASSKPLTRLEEVTRNYMNAKEDERDIAKQRVLDEILGTPKEYASKRPVVLGPSFGGNIRGLKIDIAKLAVEITRTNFYIRKISIKHQ
jgi:murein DD-endopeptidase MepM/ murein hydrolase activator NlpD